MNYRGAGGGTITGADNYIRAEGPNSRIDLSGLEMLDGGGGRPVHVEARNGGHIALAGRVFGGVIVDIAGINSNVDLANATELNNVEFQVSGAGAALTLAPISQLVDVDIVATGGASVDASLVMNYLGAGGGTITGEDNYIRADGPNSRIDFSNLQTLDGQGGRPLHIESLNGGKIDLSSVTGAPGGVEVMANGAGSVIDLSSLTNTIGVALTETDGGNVVLPGEHPPGTARLSAMPGDSDDVGAVSAADYGVFRKSAGFQTTMASTIQSNVPVVLDSTRRMTRHTTSHSAIKARSSTTKHQRIDPRGENLLLFLALDHSNDSTPQRQFPATKSNPSADQSDTSNTQHLVNEALAQALAEWE
jgi:hypothetical protein